MIKEQRRAKAEVKEERKGKVKERSSLRIGNGKADARQRKEKDVMKM